MSQAIAHRPALVGARDEHLAFDLAAGEARRPIVVVLGMHRSGTSLCSHVLSVLGADMADHLEIQPSNANGHWERLELTALHDQILELFGRGYYGPAHDLPLPVAWWADPQVRAIRQAIIAFLRHRMPEGSLFGFKDPRTARLLPLWHEVFEDLKLAPKFVLCLRNPAQVARSLAARDGLDPDLGEYRWFCYMAEALANLQDRQICTVAYEDWFDDANINLNKLLRFLDLPREWPPATRRAAIARLVDPRQRHDGSAPLEPRQPLVRSLYAMMRGLGEDPAAAERIGALTDQFAAYQELHLSLFQQFGKTSALASALPERERQLAALRSETGDLRAERDAAQARVERAAESVAAAEARLAATEAELAARDAALTRAGEKAGAAARRQEEVEARLAATEAELAAARQRGDALSAALDAVQSGHAAQRAALREAEQNAAALEEIAEAAQAAVDALRAKLAERDRQAAEQVALAESERDRIAGERDRIAEKRDRIAEERDRLAKERDRVAAEGEEWFDAAIRLPAEPVVAARSGRGWRIGRYLVHLDCVRGKGSPMQRADAARAARQWARAARFYLDALRQRPARAAIWVQLGHALREMGRRAEAEFAYRRAADLDRANRDALVPLGQVLREQDRNVEAAAAYRQALALDPPAELRAFLTSELAALAPQNAPAP